MSIPIQKIDVDGSGRVPISQVKFNRAFLKFCERHQIDPHEFNSRRGRPSRKRKESEE